MNPASSSFLLLLALLAVASNSASALESGRQPEAISAGSLLGQLTDLEALTKRPDPPYVARLASSYDRASTAPEAPGWFANGDSGQFVRAETREGRIEQVLMETDAPGAIVRFWAANPAGTLRIYFDGHATPDIVAPLAQFVDGGALGVPDPLAALRSRGHNLFLPMPYARSCKVTCENPGRLYYQINYRAYAPGTPVSTFDPAQIKALAPAIALAVTQLRGPSASQSGSFASQDVLAAPQTTTRFDERLAPGATARVGAFSGEQSLQSLRVRVAPEADEAALRALVLRIWFDGEKCVEAPLGDFFGSAPGLNRFDSLPLQIADDGEMRSRWPMPFQRTARLEIVNLGAHAMRVSGTIGVAPRAWTARSLHFHASYRAWFELPTRPMRDLNLLDARGAGRIVGATYSIDNPTRNWWGEGDEKIYRDGATFPDWFGTGTEDFFGYAWSSPQPFEHALFNQTRSGAPENYGRSSINRFLTLDSIPFENRLRFDMEMWHWSDTRVNLAAVVYWYGAPGARDAAPTTLDANSVRVLPMPPYQVPRVAGALEAETLPVIAVGGGQIERQSWADLSGEQQLWWRDARPGDALKLRFDAPRAGRYHVLMRRLKAPDYGIVQLQINGQNAGAPLDGWAPNVAIEPEIELGTFDLNARNMLTVTITGTNALAAPRFMFGLDYLRLVPA